MTNERGSFCTETVFLNYNCAVRVRIPPHKLCTIHRETFMSQLKGL